MNLKKNMKRILVRAPNWIGDAVMCLPALSALKGLFPGASITVLAKAKVHAVFTNNPEVEALIKYDSTGAHRGIKGRLKLASEIKKERFELAVLFQNAFDAAFISFISRIPERVGYARDLRTPLLTRPIDVTGEILKRHQMYYYLNIIEAMGGAPVPAPAPRITISGDERSWAAGFLEREGVADKRFVGAAPGASYGPAKRWAPKSFARTLDRLAESFSLLPVIFGGHEDMEVCSEVSTMMKSKHLNLAGMLGLRHFMAVLGGAALFITNDSGAMHMAGALKVPTVAIFGSTDPALTGPSAEHARVVQKEIDCNPCFKRECPFGHYRCLETIRPEDVFTVGAELLKKEQAWPA